MIYHVVLRVGQADLFSPRLGRDTVLIDIAMDGARGNVFKWVRSKVWPCLDAYRLNPTPVATDLYRLAAAIYCADLRAPRGGYDDWTREIVLHIPVSDAALWSGANKTALRLLRFLSGDRWTIHFRTQSVPRPDVNPRNLGVLGELQANTVSLFSGGLDSFVGSIDLLSSGRTVALVSHNALGPHRFSSPAQINGVRSLRREFGLPRVGHLQMFFDPPRVPPRGPSAETSQRARSFLFLSLGVLTSSALPRGTPLVVAENGFIALNVPLTAARLGSWSTRTTHPYALELFRQLLMDIGLEVPIETPYNFKTKGMMLENCANSSLLGQNARSTNSCGHPNDRNLPPDRQQSQCGYCVPCIIRRSAMSAVRLDLASDYRYDILTEGDRLTDTKRSDLRAFEIAIARAISRGTSGVADVLRAGPLPAGPSDIPRFAQVYRDGLAEVAEFLSSA